MDSSWSQASLGQAQQAAIGETFGSLGFRGLGFSLGFRVYGLGVLGFRGLGSKSLGFTLGV